eukprot:2675981-Rhodomonas_salina.2
MPLPVVLTAVKLRGAPVGNLGSGADGGYGPQAVVKRAPIIKKEEIAQSEERRAEERRKEEEQRRKEAEEKEAKIGYAMRDLEKGYAMSGTAIGCRGTEIGHAMRPRMHCPVLRQAPVCMRCPVLRQRMMLGLGWPVVLSPYEMSGTDPAHVAQDKYTNGGFEARRSTAVQAVIRRLLVGYWPMRCGTDLVYDAMRCAVLSWRMALPGPERAREARSDADTSGTTPSKVAYTLKSNTRNRIPRSMCTEIAVSCLGFRGSACAMQCPVKEEQRERKEEEGKEETPEEEGERNEEEKEEGGA